MAINKAKFFQDIHALPLNGVFNYQGWLSNFNTDEEIEIATILLDFFTFYPSHLVNQMFISSVSKAGFELQKKYPTWNHEFFKSFCYYSSIPGGNDSITDSGHAFTRKLRDILHIKENRITPFKEISKIPENNPIILVDDFVGSGDQVIKAWNSRGILVGGNYMNLQDFVEQTGKLIIYVPLLANHIGYNSIRSECKGLITLTNHILGPEYNIFSSDCICWNGDAKLYEKGIRVIKEKSESIDIYENEGNVYTLKGYQNQGLAIALEDFVPDALPPIFYSKEKNWTPLVNKNYDPNE